MDIRRFSKKRKLPDDADEASQPCSAGETSAEVGEKIQDSSDEGQTEDGQNENRNDPSDNEASTSSTTDTQSHEVATLSRNTRLPVQVF